MEKKENTFVGIDVAKDELVIHILPNNEQLTVPNSTEGIKTLVKRFKKIEPQQIVLEATGKLERNLVAALAANGFAIVVVNPRQARDLAKGLGELTKTDAVRKQKRLPHFQPHLSDKTTSVARVRYKN